MTVRLTIAEPGPLPAEISANGVTFRPIDAAPDPATNARVMREAIRAVAMELTPGSAARHHLLSAAEAMDSAALNRLRRLIR